MRRTAGGDVTGLCRRVLEPSRGTPPLLKESCKGDDGVYREVEGLWDRVMRLSGPFGSEPLPE